MVITGGLLSAFPLVSAVILGLATYQLSISCQTSKSFPFIRRLDTMTLAVTLIAILSCLYLTPWTIMAVSALLGIICGFTTRPKKPLRQEDKAARGGRKAIGPFSHFPYKVRRLRVGRFIGYGAILFLFT
jgi:hypothetical protein